MVDETYLRHYGFWRNLILQVMVHGGEWSRDELCRLKHSEFNRIVNEMTNAAMLEGSRRWSERTASSILQPFCCTELARLIVSYHYETIRFAIYGSRRGVVFPRSREQTTGLIPKTCKPGKNEELVIAGIVLVFVVVACLFVQLISSLHP